jgi:hypothetical protein
VLAATAAAGALLAQPVGVMAGVMDIRHATASPVFQSMSLFPVQPHDRHRYRVSAVGPCASVSTAAVIHVWPFGHRYRHGSVLLGIGVHLNVIIEAVTVMCIRTADDVLERPYLF